MARTDHFHSGDFHAAKTPARGSKYCTNNSALCKFNASETNASTERTFFSRKAIERRPRRFLSVFHTHIFCVELVVSVPCVPLTVFTEISNAFAAKSHSRHLHTIGRCFASTHERFGRVKLEFHWIFGRISRAR